MYELIALSLLMRGTVHGYVIASVINDVIGPLARASNGRIYPLLAKLEETRLVAVHEESTSDGGRVSRSFSITKAGRQRFRQLMLDTSSGPREYRDVFAFKVTAFDQITKEERLTLLEHYEQFAAAHVRHLEKEAHDTEGSNTYGHTAEHRRRFAHVFRHLVSTWQREAAWARELRSAELAAPAKRRTTRTRE